MGLAAFFISNTAYRGELLLMSISPISDRQGLLVPNFSAVVYEHLASFERETHKGSLMNNSPYGPNFLN